MEYIYDAQFLAHAVQYVQSVCNWEMFNKITQLLLE